MRNPNNCSTCEWKAHDDEGHCYMFRDEPEEVCMQHTGRQNVAFINHIPCKGNLSSLALLVANISSLEPIDFDVTEILGLGPKDVPAKEKEPTIEMEPEPENETQANLNMVLAQLGGVNIVYEADFKEEYPDVTK